MAAAIIAATVVAATVVVAAFGAAAGGRADGFGVGLALFLHGGLATEFDAALVVDEDDLHANLVADVDDVIDVLDVLVGKLGDVAKSVGFGGDFDERAEFLDADDAAGVNLPDLHLGGDGLDEIAGLFRGGLIDGADVDGSVVLCRSGRRSLPGAS